MPADATFPALQVVQLRLHGTVVGHLLQQPSGATALLFDPAWREQAQRPALTLAGTPLHPRHRELYRQPWTRTTGLTPLLANLLPEAGVRGWLPSDENDPALALRQLVSLGHALPGAWQAQALAPDAIPPGVLDYNARVVVKAVSPLPSAAVQALAGSQPKLAVQRQGDSFRVPTPAASADWIIKLPTAANATLPRNEYSILQLAALAGVPCVESHLVPRALLSELPVSPTTPDEPALAVCRFDRTPQGGALHCEDLAQALMVPPSDKVSACDTLRIGQLLYRFTPHGLANVRGFAQRLLINVLLGNGDQHLKNWSLLYLDSYHATLAPAYDLAFAPPREAEPPLTIGDCNDWSALEFRHFEAWCNGVGVPWRQIKPTLAETVERARTLWPTALDALPMAETDKLLLRHHWKSLGKRLQYAL